VVLASMWLGVAMAAEVERREVGQLVLENVPETPAALAERMRQYQNVRSAGFVDFLAGDGQGMLITTRFGEVSQLHHVASPGAARRQLTFYDEPVRGVVSSPTDPDLVMLSRDVGGSEQYQVWSLDLRTGASSQLSEGPGRASEPTFRDDGQVVAWFGDLEGTAKELVVADPRDPSSRKRVWTTDGAWDIVGFFPGGEQLLAYKYVSASESEIHQVNLVTGESLQLNRSRKPIAYADVELSPDGRHVYVASNEKSDRTQVWRLPVGRGKPQLLVEADGFDVDGLELSPDGSVLAYKANVDGTSRLGLLNTADDSELAVPELPPGIVYSMGFDDEGDTLGFMHIRADAPGDVYAFEVGGTELTRWTFSEVGGLDTETFVQPEFFRYDSFDGLSVPAFVYRAPGDGPRPVVISIHGGPEGQSRPYFSSTYQYWATELGITVVVPNVRGSRGFGSEYLAMDNGLKRKDSVADIGGLLDWIAEQPDMDAERVVVYGGSYGGYMVLASMIDFADRLAGGIDIVGISDFKTFLKNTKDYRRDLRRAEYGDERDPTIAAFFDEISPLKNADKISDPLFVIQGANDPRVPASEAEQIVAAVRGSGNEAWYMLALDEGHGFRKKSNRDAMNEAVVLYLQQVMGLE
jgi:dipeptidyl aminopeptidase/acylaminoacyl peptidase